MRGGCAAAYTADFLCAACSICLDRKREGGEAAMFLLAQVCPGQLALRQW